MEGVLLRQCQWILWVPFELYAKNHIVIYYQKLFLVIYQMTAPVGSTWTLLTAKHWKPLDLQKFVSQTLEPFTVSNLSLYFQGFFSVAFYLGECTSVKLEKKASRLLREEHCKREDGNEASRNLSQCALRHINFEKCFQWKLRILKLIPLKLSMPSIPWKVFINSFGMNILQFEDHHISSFSHHF